MGDHMRLMKSIFSELEKPRADRPAWQRLAQRSAVCLNRLALCGLCPGHAVPRHAVLARSGRACGFCSDPQSCACNAGAGLRAEFSVPAAVAAYDLGGDGVLPLCCRGALVRPALWRGGGGCGHLLWTRLLCPEDPDRWPAVFATGTHVSPSRRTDRIATGLARGLLLLRGFFFDGASAELSDLCANHSRQ